MYPANPGSPYTTLASGIDEDDTSISLTADPGFAAATNLACIWDDTGNFEVVKYTDLTGTTLTVERGFEGTAQAWSAGAYIANLIPAYAINSLQNNVNELNSGKIAATDVTYENLNANGDVGTTSGTVCAGDDPRLSDSRTPTSHGNEAHSSTFLTEIDIHGATPETAIADDDEILIYDASASANRRMTRANFLDGISAVGAFTDLTDTPASYSGYDETYYVRVKSTSDGLEFATVPSSYTLPTASADTLGGVKIGSGITITDGVISTSGGGGITWNEVTGTAQAAAADNGYICNNAALVTVTLPSTCAVGKTIRIAGKGTGLWKIAQNAGQIIYFGDQNTTSGTAGYLAAQNQYDSIELLCITANTTFNVISAVGNITVV